MKYYMIQTVETGKDGIITIIWHKHLYILREDAFEAAKKIGSNACVLEMVNGKSWNMEQILEEEG